MSPPPSFQTSRAISYDDYIEKYLPAFLYAPAALLFLFFLPLFFCDVSRPRRRRRSTFDNVCERSTLFPTLFFLTATFFIDFGGEIRVVRRFFAASSSSSLLSRRLIALSSSFSSSVPPSLHSPQLFPPSPLLKYMHLQKSSPALLMRRRGGNNSEHFFNRPENFQTIPLGGFRGQGGGGEERGDLLCIKCSSCSICMRLCESPPAAFSPAERLNRKTAAYLMG